MLWSYNFNLLKDEFDIKTWLAIGASIQVAVSLLAPAKYVLVPAALSVFILVSGWVLAYLNLAPNKYMDGVELSRFSLMFPEEDGSRPENFGKQPLAVFIVGIRSNHPLGRLHPMYQKLNDYYDKIYEDAAKYQSTNGYLGRTPDLIPANEYANSNTLFSISYWKSVEDLERFGQTPLHIKSLKFLAFEVNKKHSNDLGVFHEIMICPPTHWEGVYSNMKPWGLALSKFPLPKGGFQGPYLERDPKKINGMWGRMGRKIQQAEADKVMAQLIPEGVATGVLDDVLKSAVVRVPHTPQGSPPRHGGSALASETGMEG
ncbi:hypothetical protein B0T17DRAFT_503358 [Bombardia bombarda]|uniref:Uncharacterized protein n=1 Tax=Bombardia bombarda TaxID=252184 RepID=A0AA39XL11_9PEZI|nr:hypothetical protein B0T17DRAFT_503358 [Bombardia bombarda]